MTTWLTGLTGLADLASLTGLTGLDDLVILLTVGLNSLTCLTLKTSPKWLQPVFQKTGPKPVKTAKKLVCFAFY